MVVVDRAGRTAVEVVPAPPPARDRLADAGQGVDWRRLGMLVALWAGVLVACAALVVYGIERLVQERRQGQLLDHFSRELARAAAAGPNDTRAGATLAPATGAPVALLEIEQLGLRQVVVEGVGSSATSAGPGHVPGTAGPGQPGNSVVVGRRAGYGGAFGGIERLRSGDQILVTTSQGESAYIVSSITHADVDRADTGPYSPSHDDRLTLVTSASGSPFNGSRALVVVARLQGTPFAPTPQNGRDAGATGARGDAGAAAELALVALASVAAAIGAGWLFRRLSPGVAYLLAALPLVALAMLGAETLSRLLPAWF